MSKKDELVKELGFACTYCDGSGARQLSDDEIEQCQYCDEIKPTIADFILAREEAIHFSWQRKEIDRLTEYKARESRILGEVKDELMKNKEYGRKWAVKSTLAIVNRHLEG